MVMPKAIVEADARLGGEVLSYLPYERGYGTEVAVVYTDSVTRRVCHVLACSVRGRSMGDQDLWEPGEWEPSPLDDYAWHMRQDAFLFPDEAAARAAEPQLKAARYTADLQWEAGEPVWQSVLPNSPR
jgi:hypothetical protein